MVQHDRRADTGASVQVRRVWVSSFLGALIEFYDFSIYITASSLALAPLFFNKASPAVGLVLSFATLAIGYAARMVGAAIFGHFGDRVGRKKTLITTIVVMAVSTFLIGCLPTTETIGQVAPVLLVVLRLVQGIAVGGEWGGSVVLSTEHSSTKRRGFMGSATMTGSSGGILLGYATFAIIVPLSGEGFLSWGWRVPFWITAFLFVLAIYMRLKINESPIMIDMQKSGRLQKAAPLKDVLLRHPGVTLKTAGISAGAFMLQQILVSFYVSYGVSNLGQTRSAMVNAQMIGVGTAFVLIPVIGYLTDRLGRIKLLRFGTISSLLNAFLIWPLLSTGNYGLILLSFVLVFVFYSFCYAPMGALLAEIFPSPVRYTGVSLSYQLAALIGGLGPLLASLLAANGYGPVAITGLMVAGMVVSVACALMMSESSGVELTAVGSDDTATSAPSTPAPATETTG